MMQNKMTAPPLQGISNLMKMQGRMGDTELVHMTKPEVKGLASLGVLTTNPNTGLPEAFLGSFGRAFTNYIIPAALTIASGGNPGPAALYSGVKGFAETGNPIQGVQDALFSYGGARIGAGIGDIVGNLGTAGGQVATSGLDAEAAKSLVGELGGNLSKAAELGGQQFSNVIGQAGPATLGEVASTYGKEGLGEGFKTLASRAFDYAKTPEGIGQAIGSVLGQAATGTDTTSQPSPLNLATDENVDSGFGTKTLKYPEGEGVQRVSGTEGARNIYASLTGAAPPLRFKQTPEYLSTALLYDGGGIQDALESITDYNNQEPFEGRVTGDGDGMSDEIPFSIEGQQPALLSRDEYVLPADVVSALGNGSSNAGADKLDKFLTDVRKKVMGRERQINQIV